MPYNKLAKTKYEKIGARYKVMGELTDDRLQEIIERFKKKSFEVVCNN